MSGFYRMVNGAPVELTAEEAAPYAAGTKRHRMRRGLRIVFAEAEEAERDADEVANVEASQPPTADEIEAQVQAALNSGKGPHLDPFKLLKAKFISDLAFRLGKAPGALTGAELTAERNRIAAIYKAL